MSWDELAGQVDAQLVGVTVDLTALFFDVWQEQQAGGSPSGLLDTVERRARVGIFRAADLAARLQLQDLKPGVRHPQLLVDTAERLAQARAKIVRDRAEAVLSEVTRNMVSPYARLAAQVLVTEATRGGLKAGGIAGEATHKEFVRIRPVKEPRSHSVLEGVVKPIDEPYIIGGLAVDGPGDERLPWSERAWCGHILKYLHRRSS